MTNDEIRMTKRTPAGSLLLSPNSPFFLPFALP